MTTAGMPPQDNTGGQYGQTQGQYGYTQGQYGASQGAYQGQPMYGYPQGAYGAVPPGVTQKSAIVAAILGFFLGALGVHNFYLGRSGRGVAQLLITILSFGLLSWISFLWALYEIIMYLVSNDPAWRYDARGILLSR